MFLYIAIGVLLAICMAQKKQKKRTLVDWDDLEDTNEDLPWMLVVSADVWHPMVVDCTTITKHHDAGPDEDWSCYRVTASVGEKGLNEGIEETIQIPFWAMKPFLAAAKAAANDEGFARLAYRKSGKFGKQVAEFEAGE